MHRRAILFGAAAAALAACSRQEGKTVDVPPAPAAPDPAGVVRGLYGPYLGEGAQAREFRDQAPWSADLWRQLEAMIARSNAINEPILDFDPVMDAQDGALTDLNVTTDAVTENSHAVVRARFTNLGEQKEVLYDLVWENNGWRVDNIRTSAWDLRQIAAAPNAAAIAQ